MACNVYGTPVTDNTLKGMVEYEEMSIAAVDRARVALLMKNAEGKQQEARIFLDKAEQDFDKKGVRCLIYNATGGPLKLVAAFEFSGYVSATPYPTVLQNGQLAAFLHEKESSSSNAIVVYEGTGNHAASIQWAVGWCQRDNVVSKCYGEIRHKGTYSMTTPDSERQSLNAHIKASTFIHQAEDRENIIFSSIGNTVLPIYEAVLTLKGAL